jgi:hypothetical protein
LNNVPFTQVTPYIPAIPGNVLVTVTAAGNPNAAVINASLTLVDGLTYTVAAVNKLANIEPLVVADRCRLPAKQTDSLVKFVHLSPDAPAVDILAGKSVLFPSVSYKQATRYIEGKNDLYVLKNHSSRWNILFICSSFRH